MKTNIENIAFLILRTILSIIASVILLSVFVYFYNDTGVHIRNDTGATDYKWEPYQRKSTMIEGFSIIRMDQFGFNNLEADHQVDILLMGSSQMEAVHVKQTESPAFLMNQMTSDYVYNIGMSGHTIYNCFYNLFDAVSFYNPTKYVIIVIDNAKLDVEKMNSVIDGTWTRIPSYDSGVFYTLQKYCPIVKSLYKKIDEWIDNDSFEFPYFSSFVKKPMLSTTRSFK